MGLYPFKIQNILLALSCLWLLTSPAAWAAEAKLPSLFRGVVVASASPGARVVSVDEESIAYAGGLRPGDVIMTVNDAAIESIDDFAGQSQRLAGKLSEATVTVQRQEQPVQLLISLFSQRLLEAWGERFVANLDLRFREPKAGFVYWTVEAQRVMREHRTSLAIEAFATALHYQPDRLDTALLLAGQWNELAQARFAEHRSGQGVAALQHSVNLYQRLMAKGITREQLAAVKAQLQQLVTALGQQMPAEPPAPSPEPAVEIGAPPPPTKEAVRPAPAAAIDK